MELSAYTWYYLVAILYCLWTLNTISPQYCTACVHLIQSRDNIVLLAYTLYHPRRNIVLAVDNWYNLAKILHYLRTVSTLLLQNRKSGRYLLLLNSRHNHFAPRLVILPLKHDHFWPRLGMVRLWHDHFWPRLGMVRLEHDHFWPRLGMVRLEAWPFLTKIGYGAIRGMTFSGQDWVWCEWSMTFPGQDWVWCEWSMTFSGQDWVWCGWSITFFGQDWSWNDYGMTFLGEDWSCRRLRLVIPFSERFFYSEILSSLQSKLNCVSRPRRSWGNHCSRRPQHPGCWCIRSLRGWVGCWHQNSRQKYVHGSSRCSRRHSTPDCRFVHHQSRNSLPDYALRLRQANDRLQH